MVPHSAINVNIFKKFLLLFMRRIIPFVLFATGLWWYLYKYGDIDFKGFKRLVISIKMAIIIALALLGGPTPVLAQDEPIGFTLPVLKPEISGKGLFQSSSEMFGTAPNSNSNPGSPDNENSEATPIENSAEKSEKSIEHPYYHQPVEEHDDQLDYED